MRKFTTYIEYLLMTRHYCYVPGKGAYMLSDEPATLGMLASIGKDSRRIHTLQAPHRVVRFSPLHTYDDGMLANLLMEAEGMTYDEACRYIDRQASLLPDDFHTSAAFHIDTENFGYEAVEFETWSDIEARLNQSHEQHQPHVALSQKEAEIIAIPRYWLKRVAVILLIAVCFFANFLGLDEPSTQQQYANVLDLSMLQRGAMVHQSWADEEDDYTLQAEDSDLDEPESEIAAEETAEDAEAPVVTDAPVVAEAPAVSNDIVKTPAKTLTVSPTGKLYYIIVASCPDQKDAQRAISNLHHLGYDGIGILERDDRCRLYINRFGDRSEAEAYLKTLRQDSNFSNAWLLPVREASLSSIIKNTYDDNQLFMELSHLNQRTERDQG